MDWRCAVGVQVRAGHLKEAEEENFVHQAEKIVVSSKNRTTGGGTTTATATNEQPQETKPDKTELLLQEGSSSVKPATPQLTPRLAPKAAHQSKSTSPASSTQVPASEATQRSETGAAGGGVGGSRIQTKVVSEVTGEILSFVANEPGASQIQTRSDPDRERERPGRAPEVSHRPLTRDVATGMSPATGSSVVLGSQSSTGEENGGRKEDSPPSLSTQTSSEVCVYSP